MQSGYKIPNSKVVMIHKDPNETELVKQHIFNIFFFYLLHFSFLSQTLNTYQTSKPIKYTSRFAKVQYSGDENR